MLNILTTKKNKGRVGFYEMIKDSSSREKKRIVKKAINSANKEQKEYYKLLPKNKKKGCA